MRRLFFTIIVLILLLAACQQQSEGQGGRILLWHSWEGRRGLALEQAIGRYMQIQPEVTVITQRVPPGDLHERFKSSASQGLGPDLLLASSSDLGDLVAESIIAPIPAAMAGASQAIVPAQASVEYDGQSYGLPLALNVIALYTNAGQVSETPGTLEDLYAALDSGQTMAFDSTFAGSYWGIDAMGQPLFGTDGTMQPLDSGLVDWLDWMKRAQELPGMIFSGQTAELYDLFAAGEAGTYTAGPEPLDALSEALGPALVMAALPAGPGGPAAPIMTTEAFFFNWASSSPAAEIAFELGQFLTNQEQSSILLREAGIVPAHRLVRVDPRIYPSLSVFRDQSLTAAALPGDLDRMTFFDAGDRMIVVVLTGVETAEQAACDFGRVVAATGATVNLAGCEDTTDE